MPPKQVKVDDAVCGRGILQGDCPKGSWCCLNEKTMKTDCVPCGRKLFGLCLESETTTCPNAGMKPYNDASEIKAVLGDLAKKFGEEALKEGMKAAV